MKEDIKLSPSKICSCGKIHDHIPKTAILQEDEIIHGWFWNCSCKSTLFKKYFDLKEAGEFYGI